MQSAKFILLVALSIVVFHGSGADGCTVCHSKNPKMVRMHQELGFKDCFKCHYPGSQKSPEELKLQMTSDERCTNCHKKEASGKKDPPLPVH
jgi:predicted CXXCH cytochrome family protein